MKPIAIYNGPGAGEQGLTAFPRFFAYAGLPFAMVTPDTIAQVHPDRHAGFWLPGGWAGGYMDQMPGAGKVAVRRLVEQGGVFFGTCAGAYFAADAIRWEGQEVVYDLNLYHGTAEGSIHAIAPWESWKLTPLTLADHPANGGRRHLEALYWGGPEFCPAADQPAEVLATYDVTGKAAVITFRFGQGRVLLMGPHAELGCDFSTGRWDHDGGCGAQWDWLAGMVRWALDNTGTGR